MSDEPTWSIHAPPSRAAVWTPVWSAPEGADLRVETALWSGRSGDYQMHRVVSGQPAGAGAVVVAVHREDPVPRVLLVHQERIRSQVLLWELPRGGASPEDVDLVATGLRELEEETGVSARTGELLGTVYPDSGLLAAPVGVVLVEVAEKEGVCAADGEALDVSWFGADELGALIAGGSLRDGISMSALLLAAARGALPPVL